MIFHWMIFDKDFSKLLQRLSNGDFFENQAVLPNCFFNDSFVGFLPIKTGMICCLDAFAAWPKTFLNSRTSPNIFF